MWLTVLAACVSTRDRRDERRHDAGARRVRRRRPRTDRRGCCGGSAMRWASCSSPPCCSSRRRDRRSFAGPPARGARVAPRCSPGRARRIFFGGQWRYPYPIFPLLVVATLRFRQLGAAVGCLVVAGIAIAGVSLRGQPARGRRDCDCADPAGAARVRRRQPARSRRHADRARASDREPRRGAGARAHRKLGVGHSDRPRHVVALSCTGSSASIHAPAAHVREVPRADSSGRSRPRARPDRARARRRDSRSRCSTASCSTTGRSASSRDEAVSSSTRPELPLRLVGTSQDVTERHRVEEVRDNILSAVSHELRTPLTSVLGFALTLEQRPDDAHEAPDDKRARGAGASARAPPLGSAGRRPPPTRPRARDARADGRHVARQADDCRRRDARSNRESHSAPTRSSRRSTRRSSSGSSDNLVTNALKTRLRTPASSSPSAARASRLLLRVDDSGRGIPDELKQADLRAVRPRQRLPAARRGPASASPSSRSSPRSGRQGVGRGSPRRRRIIPGIAAARRAIICSSPEGDKSS